ncbi:unnamed protein product [Zymoseptoria tritici ST99CH_3D1]|uniref:Uncharacterized protein n=1 Tax=Zymoseptoria tritici ST99CH_1E4 TaxID=1276532 RepID=A0A2H1H9F4_ZYMTR|nr:unnamed protein product [Zymoseptoria tritici ST99CH_1E4]SMR64975.1 unnamed protein product [Zymoseptoria tritici ST99CH_3D1]
MMPTRQIYKSDWTNIALSLIDCRRSETNCNLLTDQAAILAKLRIEKLSAPDAAADYTRPPSNVSVTPPPRDPQDELGKPDDGSTMLLYRVLTTALRYA